MNGCNGTHGLANWKMCLGLNMFEAAKGSQKCDGHYLSSVKLEENVSRFLFLFAYWLPFSHRFWKTATKPTTKSLDRRLDSRFRRVSFVASCQQLAIHFGGTFYDHRNGPGEKEPLSFEGPEFQGPYTFKKSSLEVMTSWNITKWKFVNGMWWRISGRCVCYCRGFCKACKHLQLQDIGVIQIIFITSKVFKSLIVSEERSGAE